MSTVGKCSRWLASHHSQRHELLTFNTPLINASDSTTPATSSAIIEWFSPLFSRFIAPFRTSIASTSAVVGAPCLPKAYSTAGNATGWGQSSHYRWKSAGTCGCSDRWRLLRCWTHTPADVHRLRDVSLHTHSSIALRFYRKTSLLSSVEIQKLYVCIFVNCITQTMHFHVQANNQAIKKNKLDFVTKFSHSIGYL